MEQKKPKEPSGTKTMIKLQPFLIRPIQQHSWKNIPKQFQKMSDGLTKRAMHVIRVNVVDIDNKDKMAFVIRKHYGFGRFNIMFWSRWLKNKNHNPKFKCRVQRGLECKYLPRCRISKIHRKGWSCKYNARYRGNWKPRCRLTIIPQQPDVHGIDYRYEWERKKDKMYLFSKWFWRG